jgi:UDP-2,4-diacetamido-2,4,6-trideoxy-beta-L-altropyranose hydrolase
MRCLALADRLSLNGGRCHFIGRESDGDLRHLIASHGHSVHLFPGDLRNGTSEDATSTITLIGPSVADWLVVDHYDIDSNWESELRPYCRRILVIDDLANRQHDCDLLLDQNVYLDASSRYAALVPSHCTRLIGCQYALLRPEFAEERAVGAPRSFAHPLRMHIFFGGSDPTGDTLRAVRCLSRVAEEACVDIVIGAQNPERHAVLDAAAKLPNASVAIQATDMARRIARADFALGACGAAALERACLGLGTLTLITAENQRQLAAGLANLGAIVLLGESASISDETLALAIQKTINDPHEVRRIGLAAQRLFPSHINGTTYVAELMAKQLIRL